MEEFIKAGCSDPAEEEQLKELELTVLEFLDGGGQGDVHLGHWGGQLVAVKLSRDKRLCAEAKRLQALKHRNLVKYLEVGRCGDKYALVMEFCARGSLGAILKTEEHIGWELWSRWMHEIADGMEYLHRKNHAHRDVKPENILITADNVVRIADFGVSRIKDTTKSVMTATGTYRYMAPELIRSNPSSTKVDVWSFGVVLWQTLTRIVPFQGLSEGMVIYNVPLQNVFLRIPPQAPSKISELIEMCWRKMPGERPSFSHIRVQLDDIYTELDALGDVEWTERMLACRGSDEEPFFSISVPNLEEFGVRISDAHYAEEVQEIEAGDETEKKEEDKSSDELLADPLPLAKSEKADKPNGENGQISLASPVAALIEGRRSSELNVLTPLLAQFGVKCDRELERWRNKYLAKK